MSVVVLVLQAVGATQEDTELRPTGLRQLIHFYTIWGGGAEAPFALLCQDELQAVGATLEDT